MTKLPTLKKKYLTRPELDISPFFLLLLFFFLHPLYLKQLSIMSSVVSTLSIAHCSK